MTLHFSSPSPGMTRTHQSMHCHSELKCPKLENYLVLMLTLAENKVTLSPLHLYSEVLLWWHMSVGNKGDTSLQDFVFLFMFGL